MAVFLVLLGVIVIGLNSLGYALLTPAPRSPNTRRRRKSCDHVCTQRTSSTIQKELCLEPRDSSRCHIVLSRSESVARCSQYIYICQGGRAGKRCFMRHGILGGPDVSR